MYLEQLLTKNRERYDVVLNVYGTDMLLKYNDNKEKRFD